MSKIYIVLDEYIEASSVEELRTKAADLAQAIWERDCVWAAERLLRQADPMMIGPYLPTSPGVEEDLEQ